MAEPARAPGRPRDAAADEAILAATLALLGDHGYRGLTTDRIAAAAGVSKATIYRRWHSKDEVVAAAVDTLAREVPTPDTGSVHQDLLVLARGLVAVFAAPGTAGLIGALAEQMLHDPALAAALRTGFLAARRDAARTCLERGRARGEVRADLDLELVVDLLAAPFYYRVLITGDPLDDAYADRLVDALLAGVAP